MGHRTGGVAARSAAAAGAARADGRSPPPGPLADRLRGSAIRPPGTRTRGAAARVVDARARRWQRQQQRRRGGGWAGWWGGGGGGRRDRGHDRRRDRERRVVGASERGASRARLSCNATRLEKWGIIIICANVRSGRHHERTSADEPARARGRDTSKSKGRRGESWGRWRAVR